MKTFRISDTRRQTGMTLIEASVWFVLFALVIAGALKMYSSVSTSQTVAAITTDMIALRSATRGLFSGSPGGYGAYGTNLNNLLVTANKIPFTIKVTAGTPDVLTNEQQGSVSIAIGGYTGRAFDITETGLTTDVCAGIVINAASQGYESIIVNGNTILNAQVAPPLVTPSQAVAACATATPASAVFSSY